MVSLLGASTRFQGIWGQRNSHGSYKLSAKAVTNILNQVRARMQEATGAAGPDG